MSESNFEKAFAKRIAAESETLTERQALEALKAFEVVLLSDLQEGSTTYFPGFFSIWWRSGKLRFRKYSKLKELERKAYVEAEPGEGSGKGATTFKLSHIKPDSGSKQALGSEKANGVEALANKFNLSKVAGEL